MNERKDVVSNKGTILRTIGISIACVVLVFFTLTLFSGSLGYAEENQGNNESNPPINQEEQQEPSGEEQQQPEGNLPNPYNTWNLNISYVLNTGTFDKNISGVVTTTISAKWEPSEEASGYNVTHYDIVDENVNAAVVENIPLNESRTIVVTHGHKYSLRASAQNAKGHKVTVTSKGSVTYNFPSLLDSVKASVDNSNNDVTLSWSSAKNANRYYIYRSETDVIPSSPYKSVTGTSYKENNNSKGKYYYWVRPVNTNNSLAAPATRANYILIKENFLKRSVRTYAWHGTIKYKTTLYKRSRGKARKGKISGGSYVVVTGKRTRVDSKKYIHVVRVKVRDTKTGKTGWISYKAINMKLISSGWSSDWTKATKEKFVRKYKSKTKYLIWVSRYTHRTNIFKKTKGKWRLYRCFKCSTGVFKAPTPKSFSYVLSGKKYRRVSKFRKSTFYTHLSGFGRRSNGNVGNAFHTTLRSTKTGKHTIGLSSTPNTAGCVRLADKDAIWLYKKMPRRTRIIIY